MDTSIKIKKPKAPRRPAEPIKPSKTLKQRHTIDIGYGTHSIEALLAKIDPNTSLTEVYITKDGGCGYGESSYTELEYYSPMDNPNYDAEVVRYERKYKEYIKKLSIYEVEMNQYNKDKAVYDKWYSEYSKEKEKKQRVLEIASLEKQLAKLKKQTDILPRLKSWGSDVA